jgi:hypothetical protein
VSSCIPLALQTLFSNLCKTTLLCHLCFQQAQQPCAEGEMDEMGGDKRKRGQRKRGGELGE